MSPLGQALGSSLLYGCWVTLSSRAAALGLTPSENQTFTLGSSAVLALLLARVTGRPPRLPIGPSSPPTKAVLTALAAALFGTAAGALSSRATATGNAAVVASVVGSYPAVAVVIQRLLGQQLATNQLVGVLLAVASSVAFGMKK